MKMNLEAIHELEVKLDEYAKENREIIENAEQDSLIEHDAPIKNRYCFGCEGSCVTHCLGSCTGSCSRRTR